MFRSARPILLGTDRPQDSISEALSSRCPFSLGPLNQNLLERDGTESAFNEAMRNFNRMDQNPLEMKERKSLYYQMFLTDEFPSFDNTILSGPGATIRVQEGGVTEYKYARQFDSWWGADVDRQYPIVAHAICWAVAFKSPTGQATTIDDDEIRVYDDE